MHIESLQTYLKSMKKSPGAACFLLFFLFFSISGCALSAQRVHPEFENRIKTIKRPILIPPDVTMLELLPSGMIRQRPEWSTAGCRNLEKAIQLQLKDKKCTLIPLPIDAYSEQEVAEIQALYRLVHKSMKQQTFSSGQDPLSYRRFEYSLGSIDRLLNKIGADSMILISGYDRISLSGRKALIDLAVADSSGTIVYFSVKGTIRGSDLRDFASANIIVKELLSGFSRKEE
jgi:hypothetical protein